MSITLTFHGQSCFLLDDGTNSLLIDPFFTDNPVAVIAAEDISCTHIAITHGHFDHFADCEAIAKANNAHWCRNAANLTSGLVFLLIPTESSGKAYPVQSFAE